MNIRATAKFVGTSSRKVGLVAALIRGRKAREAETILVQNSKRATDPVGKVLKSAIANAENNHNLNARDLTVESVLVGPGPTLKRFRPRARGSAAAIRKRTSHITVVLSKSETKPASNPEAAITESKPAEKKEEKK
jgi:large subunit ribosomal protein L22